MTFFDDMTRESAHECVARALSEDLGPAGDITSAALVDKDQRAEGAYVFKEAGVVAGVDVVREVCRQVSADIAVTALKSDGETVSPGDVAVTAAGPARALLAAERVSLNFLSHLSGIATLTRKYVDRVRGTAAGIYDTRKTLPGLRVLEKYAVRCGGGVNHRMGLYDQVLVKDNHLALVRASGRAGSLAEALGEIRATAPDGVLVEVEAKVLEEVTAALEAGADIIMLDNMSTREMRSAMALVESFDGKRPQVEASGGVNLATVREIAKTGVDRISVGALTHSAPGVDISLEME